MLARHVDEHDPTPSLLHPYPPGPSFAVLWNGAIRGMLLNNLCVSNGCQVSFDSDVTSTVTTAPPSDLDTEDGNDNNDNNQSEQNGRNDQPKNDQEKKKKGHNDGENASKTTEEDGNTVTAAAIIAGNSEEVSEENISEEEKSDPTVAVVPVTGSATARGGMVDVSGLRSKLFELCADLSVSIRIEKVS